MGSLNMDLVAAVSSGKKLHDFVNSSSLGDALAEIELDAAYQALAKVSDAKDKASQLWSVVNHLETAEVAAEKASRSPYGILDPVYSYECYDRRVVIIVLLAIIYKYLGEEKLCMSTMDKLLNPPRTTPSKWQRLGDKYGIMALPILGVPWMITCMVRLAMRLVTGKSAPPHMSQTRIETISINLSRRLRP
jgi:hypothetical protein